jgi:hydroxyacylglutathione hydrolase
MGEPQKLVEFDNATLAERLAADDVIFVDTRHNSQVHLGTVARSLNVPGVGKAEDRPLVLLAGGEAEAREYRDHLVRVGIDRVVGYTTTLAGLPLVVPAVIGQDDLDTTPRAMLLDVRNRTEFAAGHIPGAEQLSGGRVLWHLDQLPTPGRIIAYCQSGVRVSVTASALRRAGYDVVELEGSYLGWITHQGQKEAISVG